MQVYVDDADLRRVVGEVDAMELLNEAAPHLGGWKDRQAAIMRTVIATVRELVPEDMEVSTLTLKLEIAGKICGTGLSGHAELTVVPKR